MSYEEQLSAAKFRADRDQARQDACVAKVKLDRAIKELGEAKRKAGVHGKVISDQNQRIHELKREVEKLRCELDAASKDAAERSKILEAARWVRDHGGIEGVSRLFQDADSRRVELCAALGIDLDKGWSDAMECMRRRLMPEGMEWPRYESGEPVPIGGEFMGKDGKTYTAKQIQFIGKCFSLYDFCDRKPQFNGFYGERVKHPAVLASDDDGCCDPGTYRSQEAAFTCDSCGHTVFVDKCMVDEIRYLRAKGIRTLNCCCGHDGKAEPFIIVNEGDECRMLNMGYERHVNEHGVTYFTPKSSCPTKVLAADGEPLEVGQTVWFVEDGDDCDVAEISSDGRVRIEYFDGSGSWHDASEFLHQRPVLDADGVPIREGDTVWLTGEPEYSWTVTHVSERHVGGYCNEDGSALDMHSKSLTNTKPEPPDSLERIADEIDRLREDVALHLGDYLYDEDGNDSIQFSMELVAKRCRALAERERGE